LFQHVDVTAIADWLNRQNSADAGHFCLHKDTKIYDMFLQHKTRDKNQTSLFEIRDIKTLLPAGVRKGEKLSQVRIFLLIGQQPIKSPQQQHSPQQGHICFLTFAAL
jgi:hypothetical protein